MKTIVADKVVELTEEQLAMFNALTNLQQKVCLKSLEGLNDIESYKQSGGTAKNDNTAAATVSTMLSNVKVAAFLTSMKEGRLTDLIMSREEMLERLTLLSRTSMSDVVDISTDVLTTDEEGNPVKQSYWSLKDFDKMGHGGVDAISELSSSKEGLKIKLHDAKQTMKQISTIQGYEAAHRIAVGGDPDAPPISISKTEFKEARKKMLDDDDC